MRKPLFIILIVLGFILPILAYAALVPCGTKASGRECTLCDIFVMLQMIMNYIWWFLLIIAPLFIIAGGVMILTAGVKPDQLEAGKRIITGTIIGLAIAFLSWTILNMVFNTLAKSPGEEGFPWPWNEIQCTGGGVGGGVWGTVSNDICLCEYGDNRIRATQITGFENNTYTCGFLCTSSSSTTYCNGNVTPEAVTSMRCVASGDTALTRQTGCYQEGTTFTQIGTCYSSMNVCDSAIISFASQCSVESGSRCYCQTDSPPGITTSCTSAQPWGIFRTTIDILQQCHGDVLVCSNSCSAVCKTTCAEDSTDYSVDWCQRTPQTGSSNWVLSSFIQNPNGQRGDASNELTSFLNCMFTDYNVAGEPASRLISNLQINSISSNDICNNPDCDPTTTNCGHAVNSCHFGGTSDSCQGYSYAVDFDDNVGCSAVYDKVMFCAGRTGYTTWFLPENSTHYHVSINGDVAHCACNENQGNYYACPAQ
jgi:hypothetical protein